MRKIGGLLVIGAALLTGCAAPSVDAVQPAPAVQASTAAPSIEAAPAKKEAPAPKKAKPAELTPAELDFVSFAESRLAAHGVQSGEFSQKELLVAGHKVCDLGKPATLVGASDADSPAAVNENLTLAAEMVLCP